jgi:GT2 family glycosyltransferase
MRIYILLPVYNRLEQTKKFIKSFLAQTHVNYHLILIDDGSTDGTVDYLKSRVKDLTVITGRSGWFWGGGLHQGYLWLKKNNADRQDLVLMINNDTEFGPDFFQRAIDILSNNRKTLLLARVYSKQTDKFVEAGVHADWRRLTFEHTEDPDKINCLSTRGLFMRVGDFMDIGGFHPVLLPHYLSDYEFTIRAHRKGYRLMVDPSLKLMVDESTTGSHAWLRSAGRTEFLRDYFSKRSSSNPFYWFSFVALACPWAWKPLNFLRVIYGGLATVFRKTFGIYNHKWR